MATPTVHFHSSDGPSVISNWMPVLHTLLTDAGWTIEYADADAIGGGTANNPAWDKPQANNENAGIAVYQMPLNDHTTPWFVRLRPAWGSSPTRPYMAGITVGPNHDGVGNVTGAGGEHTVGTPASGSFSTSKWLAAASEDGFTLNVTTSQGPTVLLERPRRVDTGAVTDDLVTALGAASSLNARLTRAGVGEVHSRPLVGFGAIGNGGIGQPGSSTSFASYDGSDIPVLGPFCLGGFPVYSFRLTALLSNADHSPSSDRMINIDGGLKAYRVADAAMSAQTGYWAVATE